MASIASVFIDEVDVTDVSLEGSLTRALNRPATAQVKLPMSASIGGAGSLLKLYFDGALVHHGRVLLCETSCDENTGYTVYNSTDPLELWQHRPVRDPPDSSGVNGTPGNFSKPSILQDFGDPSIDASFGGPRIVQAMIEGSEDNSIPDDSEGPLFLVKGSFPNGSVNLSAAPADWPMTMAELATILTATGELDIVVTPIELDVDGNYGQIDCYNGNFGTDLSGSIVFQYGMGLHNVRALRWNEDMTRLCNKLWYYLGPKCDDQHWQANITATQDFDNCMCAIDCNDIRDAIVDCQGVGSGSMGGSRGTYGVRMEIKVFDALADAASKCREGAGAAGQCLYQQLWLIEAWLRCMPQTIIHVTPTRDTGIGDFDIGDLVLVEASADVRGGFSGAQRVYAYTVSWDQDSVLAVSELQTSLDQEGFAA